jgi:hypothetical protein
MARNGKAYLSAPPGDDPVMASLLRAFEHNKRDIWRGPGTPEGMTDEAWVQLGERDALVRVLNARSSCAPNMREELETFQRLRREDGNLGQRVIFNLITDPSYARQPDDAVADYTFDTTNKPQSAWLPTIFSEIGDLKADTKGLNSPLFVLGILLLVCILAILALAAIGDLRDFLFWLPW